MFKSMLIFTCVAMITGSLAISDAEWEAYKKLHKKQYETKLEDSIRRELLADNLDEINEFNVRQAPKLGFKLGTNQFSDLTRSELKRFGRTKSSPNSPNSRQAQEYLDSIISQQPGRQPLPSRVDWRLIPNRVTEVKDQGLDCKSSWAFAAVS